MKQAMQAVATIALAVGLAAAAQAAGTYEQSTASPTNKPAATTQMQRTATTDEMRQGRVSHEQIREAQQQLKAAGLFKGRIDGRMTHQLKVAISRFQQQNGLRRTATLDHATLARLGGGVSGAGVGSSMPRQSETTTAPNTLMNAPATTPTNPALSGAGGTNPSSTKPAPIGSPKQP